MKGCRKRGRDGFGGDGSGLSALEEFEILSFFQPVLCGKEGVYLVMLTFIHCILGPDCSQAVLGCGCQI